MVESRNEAAEESLEQNAGASSDDEATDWNLPDNIACDLDLSSDSEVEKQDSDDKINDGICAIYENFVIWPNRDALCWLNSTLALLLHSSSVRRFVESSVPGNCEITKIYNDYKSILNEVNQKDLTSSLLFRMREQLRTMQEYAFNFFQNKMRFVKGQPDSPVSAIPLLLKEHDFIKNMFEIKHWWSLDCEKCSATCIDQGIKTVVSFQKITKDFSLTSPDSLGICKKCWTQDHKRKLHFEKLPQTLIYHFENGYTKNPLSTDFEFQGEKYAMKGFILRTKVHEQKHFMTWIRNVTNNTWMNCDDLEPGVHRFADIVPEIKQSEVHIVMWERVSTVAVDDVKNSASDKVLPELEEPQKVCTDLKEHTSDANSPTKFTPSCTTSKKGTVQNSYTELPETSKIRHVNCAKVKTGKLAENSVRKKLDVPTEVSEDCIQSSSSTAHGISQLEHVSELKKSRDSIITGLTRKSIVDVEKFQKANKLKVVLEDIFDRIPPPRRCASEKIPYYEFIEPDGTKIVTFCDTRMSDKGMHKDSSVDFVTGISEPPGTSMPSTSIRPTISKRKRSVTSTKQSQFNVKQRKGKQPKKKTGYQNHTKTQNARAKLSDVIPKENGLDMQLENNTVRKGASASSLEVNIATTKRKRKQETGPKQEADSNISDKQSKTKKIGKKGDGYIRRKDRQLYKSKKKYVKNSFGKISSGLQTKCSRGTLMVESDASQSTRALSKSKVREGMKVEETSDLRPDDSSSNQCMSKKIIKNVSVKKEDLNNERWRLTEEEEETVEAEESEANDPKTSTCSAEMHAKLDSSNLPAIQFSESWNKASKGRLIGKHSEPSVLDHTSSETSRLSTNKRARKSRPTKLLVCEEVVDESSVFGTSNIVDEKSSAETAAGKETIVNVAGVEQKPLAEATDAFGNRSAVESPSCLQKAGSRVNPINKGNDLIAPSSLPSFTITPATSAMSFTSTSAPNTLPVFTSIANSSTVKDVPNSGSPVSLLQATPSPSIKSNSPIVASVASSSLLKQQSTTTHVQSPNPVKNVILLPSNFKGNGKSPLVFAVGQSSPGQSITIPTTPQMGNIGVEKITSSFKQNTPGTVRSVTPMAATNLPGVRQVVHSQRSPGTTVLRMMIPSSNFPVGRFPVVKEISITPIPRQSVPPTSVSQTVTASSSDSGKNKASEITLNGTNSPDKNIKTVNTDVMQSVMHLGKDITLTPICLPSPVISGKSSKPGTNARNFITIVKCESKSANDVLNNFIRNPDFLLKTEMSNGKGSMNPVKKKQKKPEDVTKPGSYINVTYDDFTLTPSESVSRLFQNDECSKPQ